MSNWLDEEAHEILIEKRKNESGFPNKSKQRKRDTWLMLKIVFFTLIFFSVFGHPIHARLNPPVKKSLFPDTWTCKKCGYDNFKGIDSCGVCGHSRWNKNR